MARGNLVGETILGYQIVAEIGNGAFGTVYKAVKSNVLGDYVRALKHITFPTSKQYASVLNSMGGDSKKADDYFAESLRSIATEITLLSSLSEIGSTHIVRYYESDLEVEESPRRYDVFVLMEYATPLEDYIARRGFTVRDAIEMGLQVLEGISVCHDNGVIHRDIKEDNIFVDSDGRYKLGDFGVSKILKDSSRAESLKGTPNYLAPEVYLGRGGYTKSVDLYSLGIVLYRLLNYERNPFLPPFPESYFADDEDRAFERRMKGERAPLPALGGEAIGTAIVKAILDEQQRYQSADSFILALKTGLMNTSDSELAHELDMGGTSYDDGEQASTVSGIGETIRVGLNQLTPAEPIESPQQNSSECGELNVPPVQPTLANDSVGEQRGNAPANVSSPFTYEEPIESQSIGGSDAQQQGGVCAGVGAGHYVDKKKAYILWGVLIAIGLAGALASYDVPNGEPMALSWLLVGAALCGLLCTVGKSIHTKGDANSASIMKDNEPYLIAADARANMATVVGITEDAKDRECLAELKRLEERLSSEPKFGYSNPEALACENEIAKILKHILSMTARRALAAAPGFFVDANDESLMRIRSDIAQVNHLLDKRRLLARH